MTARAAPQPIPASAPEAEALGWGAMRLSTLLAALADRNPQGLAFVDQPGREAWLGRPSLSLTYQVADAFVRRLGGFLQGLKLPGGTAVGICLPGGSEACLAILAVERAGLTPCLIPLAWSDEARAAAVEAANVQAVITLGVVADLSPAEAFCRLAARYFGLRFVAAFGPQVPDGVIDLDRFILEGGSEVTDDAGQGPEAGIITFAHRESRLLPVFRSCQSSVAAAVTFLVAAQIGAGERIVSLVAPDDHRGLTTGLVTALLSSAALECHGLFDGTGLAGALARTEPTFLVAPGWLEPALAAAGFDETAATAILVHDAPVRFKARTALRRSVVDVLAFGETALIARARTTGGQFALSLDEDALQSSITTRNLLRIRRDEDGSIAFAGLAAQARVLERGVAEPAPAIGEWRPSGFRADVFAGIVIGVS